nr:AMP-binding protein [uncultured Schaedlerella sp.]
MDTDLMYILFTSGSTGTPKGVAVMHRSVIDYINALQKKVNLSCNDVIGNQAPFYTDMSLKDIYMSINAGATLCIIPQKYFLFPKKLLEYLEEKRVTFLMWVPTAYAIIYRLDGLSKIRPKYLKRFWFSGEAMSVSLYRYWKKYYPNGEYAQLYGPTEATGACTFYNITSDYKDEEIIPIGKPFENTGIFLLDENDKEIRNDMLNMIGEICVYGTCLSAGYYNNRRLTDETFVDNPLIKSYSSKIYRTGDLAKWDSDGNLIFITRKDYQIKHRGKRIELGEIENAVLLIKQIKSCCCIHNKRKDELVLFYTGEIDVKNLIDKLKKILPQYMIPMDCRNKKQLPILSNGKLDRKQMEKWINGF